MSSSLSLRTERALKPRPYYFERLFEAICDAWYAAPSAHDGFQEHLDNNPNTTPVPPDALKYNDSKGWLEFRRLLCDLLQRTSMHGHDVAPENLALAAGVNAVLEQIFFCVCDPGNACLIPAPYYPMFDIDLAIKNDVRAWPVHFDQHPSISQCLSEGYRDAAAARATPRAVLITHPDNPTGKVYSPDELKEIMRWCCEHRVHCVVDEIYALSSFASEAPVRSAIVTATELADDLPEAQQAVLWDHVHVIIGLSKDFCMSGFRVGGLYTYNAQLLHALDNLADFNQVSSITQWQLMCMFNDGDFVDAFLLENRANLEANCKILTAGLDEVAVAYHKPRAGFFVWMDLREKIGISTWDRERDIFNAMFTTVKVFCVPGEACHAAEPGFFRVCFTAHPAVGIHELVRRLQEFINKYSVFNAKQSWNTQSYMLAGGFGMRR